MNKTTQIEVNNNVPVIQMRPGQRRCFQLVDTHRLLAFVARRQYGKTTTFANIALKKMMRTPGHTVIFGSAKLNLSREIVRKEAEVIEKGIAEAITRLEVGRLVVADAIDGRTPDHLTHDDFADMFEAQRLEFRFFHSRTIYSRTKVVALRPDTVGETGDLMCDEIGRIQNWREVWEAVEPIVSSNPDFRLLLSTTPPPDDAHYSFSQLAPPPGTEFEVRPEGNVYESDMGVTVLRLDAYDAYAGGVPVYSLRTGQPMSPEEHRAAAHDKDAWDRNYGCLFISGGSAAISLFALLRSQQLGVEFGCKYYHGELPVEWIKDCQMTPGVEAVIGVDPATTEKKKSNPTGFCVSQMIGSRHVARILMRYRKADPKEARAIITDSVLSLQAYGVPVRCVAIDATNEKYWALETREEIETLCGCPVLLVVSSETEMIHGESVKVKTALGIEAVATFDDNMAAVPPDPNVKSDLRLVKRYKGGFDNDVDADGNHGDMFDGYKLALRGHLTDLLVVEAEAVQVGNGSVALHNTTNISRMPMRPDAAEFNERSDLWT